MQLADGAGSLVKVEVTAAVVTVETHLGETIGESFVERIATFFHPDREVKGLETATEDGVERLFDDNPVNPSAGDRIHWAIHIKRLGITEAVADGDEVQEDEFVIARDDEFIRLPINMEDVVNEVIILHGILSF